MGLLDKVKGKQEAVDWSDAYNATPKFYKKPDGNPFGAIALTESTKTILPKNPQLGYRIDGKVISEWKLVIVSISEDKIMGDTNYFSALKKAEKYALDANENFILIKGLSLAELENLKE